MIITRTPLRVSFCGGGTDFKDFYKLEPGAVISTAINKYVYITVNERFENTIRVSYSQTEIVSEVDEIQHPIVREAMKFVGIDSGVELVSIADVPAGTGLGSSSSFTVGVLNALYAYKGCIKSAKEIARDACQIEIDFLGRPIGKQDQYIAAYGGICHIQFKEDESVNVNPLVLSNQARESLEQSLLLFYTGKSHDGDSILSEQKANMRKEDNLRNLKRMRNLALEMRTCMLNGFNASEFGRILNEGWLLKKDLAGGISDAFIDGFYNRALDAGALGGKLLGAGGRGFLLIHCPPERQMAVKQALKDLRILKVSLEPEGSKIVHVI